MTKVIIESPFAPKSKWFPIKQYQSWRNIRYARALLKDSLSRKEAPFASHLLYTQFGVLDDTDAGERLKGIYVGFAWATVAEKTVVGVNYGISRGMQIGMEHTTNNKREIEIRYLKDWNPFTGLIKDIIKWKKF
jgi:hypothetical protein